MSFSTTTTPTAMGTLALNTVMEAVQDIKSNTGTIYIRPGKFKDLSILAQIDAEAFIDDEYFAWLCPNRKAYRRAWQSFMYRLILWRYNSPTWRIWIAYTLTETSPPREDQILGYALVQRLGFTHEAYAWYQDNWTKYLIRSFCFILTGIMHYLHLDPVISREAYLRSTKYHPPNPFPNIEERLHLQQLSVLPAAQGKGVGSRLFEHIKGVAEEDGVVITLESSHVAEGFYKAKGCVDRGKVVLDPETNLWARNMVWSADGKAEEMKKVRWEDRDE